MRQIVIRGTPETGYQILQGHRVHIKQSPKRNLHFTKEHKSLGGLKTNFNFEVKNKKYIYRSQHSLHLKTKRIYSETQKNPEYEKKTS